MPHSTGCAGACWPASRNRPEALPARRRLAYDCPFRDAAARPVMFADRIEGKWLDAFSEVLARCALQRGDTVAILSETQSRQLNVQLAELAALRLGARAFHVVVPSPRNNHPVPVRSTGASAAIGKLAPVV